jgi:hypothetical protein
MVFSRVGKGVAAASSRLHAPSSSPPETAAQKVNNHPIAITFAINFAVSFAVALVIRPAINHPIKFLGLPIARGHRAGSYASQRLRRR